MADFLCSFLYTTPNRPGAIAIIQLIGDVEPVLRAVTGRDAWRPGSTGLADLAGIDRGMVARIADDVAQLMPHGGMRVVQRLIARLVELGVTPADVRSIDPRKRYPEADDDVEAIVLHALARARSPLAIDLLLRQRGIWRSRPVIADPDCARSARLNRLIDPPSVVLAGPPNVGKSTLSNALLGRSMSIALDLPGTTRDYVTGRVELAGLIVNWHDTPGLRESGDAIELQAIEIARRLMDSADLLIAMTDYEHNWPELMREPDLKVANKADIRAREDADLAISATAGAGVAEFVKRVRDTLVPPADLAHDGPWLFDERLLSPTVEAAIVTDSARLVEDLMKRLAALERSTRSYPLWNLTYDRFNEWTEAHSINREVLEGMAMDVARMLAKEFLAGRIAYWAADACINAVMVGMDWSADTEFWAFFEAFEASEVDQDPDVTAPETIRALLRKYGYE